MTNSTRRQEELRELGWLRFYGLAATVIALTVIVLIWFNNMPGLQDPATGELSQGAANALIAFPAIIFAGSILIVILTNRK